MKKEKTFAIEKLFVLIALGLLGISCSSDDSSSLEPIPPVVTTLDGNYKGTWSSTTPSATFTNVPISAKLQFAGSNNILVGDFFVSGNFTVCCSSGSNDGTLTINMDGDDITSFHYNDVITGCSGVFDGTGIVRENDKALVIDFTGTDCDGDHVGQIVLKK